MAENSLLYPSGEEVLDWAEAKVKIEKECMVEAMALRNGRNGNIDKEFPKNYQYEPTEKQPEIEEKPLRNKGDRNDHHEEDTDEVSEVEGDLPPLVNVGLREMVCINYELRQTRYGLKDYLKWIDEDTGQSFQQFFRHYDKYPVNSKAVLTYIAAMGLGPKRADRINMRHLVGLRAEVYVETVTRTFSTGVLKGKPMHESLNYSKVAEFLRPLVWVGPDTLNQLRKRC